LGNRPRAFASRAAPSFVLVLLLVLVLDSAVRSVPYNISRMESTRDRLHYRPAPARGFALYIPQGEFPAGQQLGGRILSGGFHASISSTRTSTRNNPFRNSLYLS
jgi:hypothetical protein